MCGGGGGNFFGQQGRVKKLFSLFFTKNGITVIKVVKKLIKQKNRENETYHASLGRPFLESAMLARKRTRTDWQYRGKTGKTLFTRIGLPV